MAFLSVIKPLFVWNYLQEKVRLKMEAEHPL
jgi:hypothetical protein